MSDTPEMRTVYVVEITGSDKGVTRRGPFDTFDEAVVTAKWFRYPQAVIRPLLVHPDGFLVDPALAGAR